MLQKARFPKKFRMNYSTGTFVKTLITKAHKQTSCYSLKDIIRLVYLIGKKFFFFEEKQPKANDGD